MFFIIGKKHPIKSMLKFFYHFNHLRCLNSNSDAIICHYPDAIKSFKKEGYKGPIYMCTQVGVDTDVYKPMMTLELKSGKIRIRGFFCIWECNKIHC